MNLRRRTLLGSAALAVAAAAPFWAGAFGLSALNEAAVVIEKGRAAWSGTLAALRADEAARGRCLAV